MNVVSYARDENCEARQDLASWIVVTGLDGAGKTTLVHRLARRRRSHHFRLPLHRFVKPALRRSGHGRQMGDVHTDRLLMALDARLANYRITTWRRRYSWLVSQRGWMDNYIFGAAQGVGWSDTDDLLRPAELERPTAIIYLVAQPEIAFSRISRDRNADRFETLPFLHRQWAETLRFYDAVRERDRRLHAFHDIPTTLIDTSHLNPATVFKLASRFLGGLFLSAGRPTWGRVAILS